MSEAYGADGRLLDFSPLAPGDRVICRAWSKPYVVERMDSDAEGRIVWLRRWDGFRLRFRFHERDLQKIVGAVGPWYRIDLSKPCLWCGRCGDAS